MKTLLLLILLLVPSAAIAELTFDLSCDNVADIVIIRDEDTLLAQRAPGGIVHSVTFVLKPESLRAFQAFVEVSRQAQYSRTAKPYPLHAALSITANGEPLQCDILETRGYSGMKVITFLFNEQDAYDTARAVCPTLTPDKVVVARQGEGAEDSPLPTAVALHSLSFDISCENVTKVTIIRQKDSWLQLHTPQGFIHLLFFQLKPEAGDRFETLVAASRKLHPLGEGGVYYQPQLTVTANGQPLQNDVTGIEGNGNGRVGTVIMSEQDALDAAQAVCPALAPGKIIIDWEKDGND